MKKSVVVSGGSSGIGEAIVAGFLDADYDVINVDILPPLGVDGASYLQADVCDPQFLAAVPRHFIERPIAHLVTCAGRVLLEETKASEAGRLPEEDVFAASVDLNLAAHYRMLLATLPNLEEMAEEGEDVSVTFISSINAFGGFGAPAYSAAKAGLHGLAAALAPVLGPLGIRVNVVAPGTTVTPRTQAEAVAANNPERFVEAAAKAPLRRVADPKDIAATVLALALDLHHVTGQVLIADGGQTLQR